MTIALPEGPFDVILADPPWEYQRKVGQGVVGEHYDTMSDSDLYSLPVAEIAAPSAMLFLWATWPKLIEATRVVESWGFDYLTVAFLWVKTYDNGGIFHGVGYYAKSNTEPCLLARRGKAMKPAVDDVSSVIVSPRREHSRKPEAVRTRISRMYPNARKVELFCRESAEGWQTWGNQVDSVGFARQEKLVFGEAIK